MRAPKTETGIRREQIAQAALELMGTQGVQALSIAGVAQRVGLVPSGIYRHFKGKEQLLDAVLELIGKKLKDNLTHVTRQTPDALERLRLLLESEIRMLLENRAIPQVIFSESIFTDHQDRRSTIKAIIADYFGQLAEIVRQGQQEKRLRQDIEPMAIALMFKGMIMPAVVLAKATNGKVDLARQAESAWELFRTAVAIQSHPPAAGETQTASGRKSRPAGLPNGEKR